jgi:hypothetical protein
VPRTDFVRTYGLGLNGRDHRKVKCAYVQCRASPPSGCWADICPNLDARLRLGFNRARASTSKLCGSNLATSKDYNQLSLKSKPNDYRLWAIRAYLHIGKNDCLRVLGLYPLNTPWTTTSHCWYGHEIKLAVIWRNTPKRSRPGGPAASLVVTP